MSIENYLDAVELSISNESIKNSSKNYDGDYTISNNGKEIKRDEDTNIKVSYDGKGLTDGMLKIEKGTVTKITGGKIDKWNVKMDSGKINLLEILPESSLVTGMIFNSSIKTLVSGVTTGYSANNTTLKQIIFLGNGILPSGYNEQEFLNLSKVDISSDKDNSILALYDGNDIVYIYSENVIAFNAISNNMFNNFTALTNLDFNGISTSKVTDMNSMFTNLTSLTILDLSKFDTSKATNMSFMFSGLSNLEEINVSNFDTSNVIYMQHMFYNCSKLTELDLGNFNTSNVTTMYNMFYLCKNLIVLNVSNFNTSQVTNMGNMFRGLNNVENIDVSKFDTSKVTNMSYMFAGLQKVVELKVSKFNTSNVTTMDNMFLGCSKLSTIDVSKFNTSQVTTIYQMFRECKELKELDLSSFDISKVTNMDYIFVWDANLSIIYVGPKWIIGENTSANSMYSQCKINTTTLKN